MYNYIKGVGEIWVGHEAPPSDSTNTLWLKLDHNNEQRNGQLLWWNPKKGHWDTATTDYMLFNNVYGVATPPESFVPIDSEDSMVYIGAGAGTYTHFLNEDGNPIVIESNTALVLFTKPKGITFWTYKTLELKGEQGIAATIVLGDIYTGEPGSETKIWNSGDENHAVINFMIPRGNRGFHFTPYVDDESNISWTNNGNLPNPETKNIKGHKGDKGDQGVVGPVGPMPEIIALSNRIAVHKSNVEGDNSVGLDVEQRNIEHDKLLNRELQDAHPLASITGLTDALSNKLDVNPDGTTPLIAGNKLNSRYIPEWILGSVKFGGSFDSDGIIHSDETKLDGKDIAVLSDIPSFYETWKGWYFICAGNYTLQDVDYEPGDWAVNNGKAGWQKIDNTDLVSGVKGNAESSYRIGLVNITPADIGLGNIDNTADIDKPVSTAVQNALDLKLDKNTPITAATATKVTYDSDGLIINGEALLASDIPNLDTSQVTTGVFDEARIPAITADKVPDLDAGKITTGILPVVRGGTGTGNLRNITVGQANKIYDNTFSGNSISGSTLGVGLSMNSGSTDCNLNITMLPPSNVQDRLRFSIRASDYLEGNNDRIPVVITSSDPARGTSTVLEFGLESGGEALHMKLSQTFGSGASTSDEIWGLKGLNKRYMQLDSSLYNTGLTARPVTAAQWESIKDSPLPNSLYYVTLT